jgi:hypothetical protein
MLRLNSRLWLLLALLLVIVASNVVFAQASFAVTVTHTGNASAGNVDFLIGTSDGIVDIFIHNNSTTATSGVVTVDVPLPGGLTFNVLETSENVAFVCTGGGTANANCTTNDVFTPDLSARIRLSVNALPPEAGPFTFTATVSGGGAPAPGSDTDDVPARVVAPSIDLVIVDLTREGNAPDNHIAVGTGNAQIIVSINQIGTIPSTGQITLIINLGGGLTFNAMANPPPNLFSCMGSDPVICTTTASIQPGTGDTIRFTVNAPANPLFDQENVATLLGGGDPETPASNATDTFSIVTSGSATPTGTLTATAFPTFPIPSVTVAPTSAPPTVIPTATLIPNPATRTPPPRLANAGQAVGPVPVANVTVVVDRDGVNVRLYPAIGAEVIATVNAGYSTNILSRSPDNQWVQVVIAGQLGWIGTPVLAIISGDLNTAPVSDPRTIPYGGFENPRAGLTSVTSQWTGKLETSGLRVRGGPGRAYPVLANAPRYTIFSLLGRTADNVWLQVNFEGTLGWVTTQFVELQQGFGTLDALPIDGIVADSLPVSEPTGDNYLDTLRLMLARVNLAQPSLDEIRSIWTNIALGQRAQCSNFPARPTNFNIPNPVLAPFYATLFPINTDFNAAMTSLREAIDLFIEICSSNQPTEGFVGQPVVQAALDAINLADTHFVTLRQRITALLPPDRPLTDDECLFSFQNRSQIVPRLRYNEVILADIDQRNFVIGFCFDAGAGQSLRIEALKVTGNAEPRLTVSAFDNATNFIASANLGTSSSELGSSTSTNAILQPIIITQTGRYILIIADLDGAPNAPLDGQIALLLTDVTGRSAFSSPGLGIDPATGNVIVVPGGSVVPAAPGANLVLTPGVSGFTLPTATATVVAAG